MGKFEDKLPKYYFDVSEKLGDIYSKIASIHAEMERTAHECDCQYCDVVDEPVYSSAEREVMEDEIDKLHNIADTHKDTLQKIESYAKWKGVKIKFKSAKANL